jgi:biopolymer transport protein ExbD
MRVRRLHKRPAQLEITAFLNLIVVLVPFLLTTAVFSRLAVLDLTLPPQSSGLDRVTGDLQLEVVIRKDELIVEDRVAGVIQRFAKSDAGYDFKALSQLMRQVKEKFPSKTEATLLAEPTTSYDVLVQVMDAVRVGYSVQDATISRTELFPDISIGDAPVRPGTGS